MSRKGPQLHSFYLELDDWFPPFIQDPIANLKVRWFILHCYVGGPKRWIRNLKKWRKDRASKLRIRWAS